MAKEIPSNYTAIRTGGSYDLYRDPAGKFFVRGIGDELKEITGGNQLDIAQRQYDQYLKENLPKQVAAQQTSLSEEFRKNVPTYTGLLQDQSKKTIQRNLAEKMSGLKQQSSSRGFLKGSGTQRQQAEALASAQVETQQKDFDIQDAVEKQAQQFENQALATKLSQQGAANQAYIDQLRQNILDTQRHSELWKALGSAIGPAAGYYLANQNKGG